MKIRVFQQTGDCVDLEDRIEEFLTCGPKVEIHFVVSVSNCLTVWYEESPVKLEGPDKNLDRNLLEMSVNQLPVSTRVSCVLASANICQVGELIKKTSTELRRYRNFGPVSLVEINRALGAFGLSLKS